MKTKIVPITFLALTVLFIGIFLTLKHHTNIETGYAFDQKTTIIVKRLDHAFETYLENLFAIRSFYHASIEVERHEFKKFVSPILKRHQGIQALEWIPIVERHDRKLYEDKAINDGLMGFTFVERDNTGNLITSSQKEKYFPVYFLEPYIGNEKALGFDLSSNQDRLESINLSLKTKKESATKSIKLVQDKVAGFGILIFVPVFNTSMVKRAGIDQDVKGFVLGVININRLVNEALKGLYDEEFSITIYEANLNNDIDRVIYTNYNRLNRDQSLDESSIAKSLTIDVVDKQWKLSIRPTSQFYKSHTSRDAWIVLLFGILFTFFLSILLSKLLHRSQTLEQENTARKKVELELHKSERRVKNLIESAPDALLLVDSKGYIVFANKEVESVFGYSPNELIGKWHDMLVPEASKIIHSTHRENYFSKPHTRPMGEGLELFGRKKGGHHFPIEIKLSPLYLDDETQVICIARDVTKQKESEKSIKQRAFELNSLYEMGKNVSESLSINQVIQSAFKSLHDSLSPDTSDIFLSRDEKLIPQQNFNITNRPDDTLIHTHKVGECLCGIAASSEKAIYSIDIHKDKRCTGDECKNAGVISFASLPLIGKEGLIGVIGIGSFSQKDFQDQSEFLETLAKQVALALENAMFYQKVESYAEDLESEVSKRTFELEKAKEKAESADTLKSAFLASMSHELRTPLNSIIGFTSMILQGIVGPLNTEQDKQLTMVKASANHLLSLINDILDLSKIEAGELKITDEQVDYDAVVKQSILTLQPLADKKSLELSYTTGFNQLEITTDSQKVEQILLNLINNAIKFTDKGYVKIICKADKNYLTTSVVDTGIGLEKEDFEKIFKTFQQTDSGLSRKYEGTGLGLSISKKLTHLLGGKLWVESKGKNKGCTFSFTLPLRDSE